LENHSLLIFKIQRIYTVDRFLKNAKKQNLSSDATEKEKKECLGAASQGWFL
jgi:hypothetical protein